MTGLHILAVDDDPVTLALLEKHLPPRGHRLDTVDKGSAALQRMDTIAYDVVITDLMMPGGLDGLGVLKGAKARHPASEVVLLTAHATIRTAVEAMKQGAFDYLQKPIDFEELDIILERIAGLRQLRRESGELRQAMEITEHNAAETIGRLEMEVARLQTALENISRCLRQPDASAPEKLGEMASLLSRAGLPP